MVGEEWDKWWFPACNASSESFFKLYMSLSRSPPDCLCVKLSDNSWTSPFNSLSSPIFLFCWDVFTLGPSFIACDRLQLVLMTLLKATSTECVKCSMDGDSSSLWSALTTISAVKSPSLSGRGPSITSSTNLEMLHWTSLKRLETMMWSSKRTKLFSRLTSSRASLRLRCIIPLFFLATAMDSW